MFFSTKKNKNQDKTGIANVCMDVFPHYFDNFPIAVILTSLDGKILFSNTTLSRLLGYSKKELETVNAVDLYVMPGDRPILLEALKKNIEIKNFETKLKRKDGAPIGVKLNSELIFSGEKGFLLTTFEDSSKTEKIEESLAETNKKFQFLYENSSDAIMRLSPPSWNFIAGNKATVAMFRVKDEKAFVSLAPWEVSPQYQPDGELSTEKAKKMIQKAVVEGSIFFEWVHKRSDGEEFFATVLLIRLEEHGQIFLQAIVRDIDQQKKTEEKLQNFLEDTKRKLSSVIPFCEKVPTDGSEESDNFKNFSVSMDSIINMLKDRTLQLEMGQKAMSSVLEDLMKEKNRAEEAKKETEAVILNSGDGILVVNNEGVSTLFNPAAEKMFGWKEKEVVGKKCSDTVAFYSNETEKEPNMLIKEVLSSGVMKKLGQKAVLKRKDGVILPISDSISPIKDSGGKVSGVVVTFSDFTKEREIDLAKSEFVSLASHQLRTPISATLWFAEMLLDGDVGELNEKQKEYLEEISFSNKRMELIVSALLNISRIEMGTVVIDPIPVDIGDFMNISLSHLEATLKKKNISLEKKIQKDLPLIEIDLKLLNIVLDNLLSNAVNYTPLEGNITVGVSKNNSDLVIEVSDDGIGIPKEDQSKIFSKLFRSDNAKEIDTTGTGIGLFMTKSIVESWNGAIYFSSPVAKKITADGKEKFVGTSFFVTIPLSGMIKKKGTTQLI